MWPVKKADFPYPSLNPPNDITEAENEKIRQSFAGVENYIDLIAPYIFTDIDMDHKRKDESHIHAWILRVVSANLLRSLYIRNAVVDAFNYKNTVAIYLPLKAWFEVVGVLASILDLLDRKLSADEMFINLKAFALGNRGDGSLRLGNIDAVNVITMIEKADKFFRKLVSEHELDVDKQAQNYFSEFYDVASNPSHPSYDAYRLVGSLVKDEAIWKAKSPSETEQETISSLSEYGGLLVSPLAIESLCIKIFEYEKEHIEKIKCKKYFD